MRGLAPLVVNQAAGHAEELLHAPAHGQRRRLIEQLVLLQPLQAPPYPDLQARDVRVDLAALRGRFGVLGEEGGSVNLAGGHVVDEEASVHHHRRVCREKLCDAGQSEDLEVTYGCGVQPGDERDGAVRRQPDQGFEGGGV